MSAVGAAWGLMLVLAYIDAARAFPLLWVPVAVFVLSAILGAVRAHPKHIPGTCFSCGYDLTGLDDGAVCPECGSDRAGRP